MDYFLNKKFRKIRTVKGLSQQFMANKLGISQRAYSKIELNQTQLTWNKIIALSNVLEVSPWEVISLEVDNIIIKNDKGIESKDPYKNINLFKILVNQYESKIKSLEAEVKFLREVIIKKD